MLDYELPSAWQKPVSIQHASRSYFLLEVTPLLLREA